MAYKLDKPYTDIEYADFVVEYNHNKGLRIEEVNPQEYERETEDGTVKETLYDIYALEAWEKLIDGEVIEDKEAWEKEKAEREKERVRNLTMTKRIFALGLQELGITYTQLKELIASNEQAQLEWDLCVELQRGNPLLDVMGAQLGVSAEQLDEMFRKANGEDV